MGFWSLKVRGVTGDRNRKEWTNSLGVKVFGERTEIPDKCPVRVKKRDRSRWCLKNEIGWSGKRRMGNKVKDRSLVTPELGEVRVTVRCTRKPFKNKTKTQKASRLRNLSGGVKILNFQEQFSPKRGT